MQNLEIKNDRYDKKTMNLLCNMPMPHKCPIPGSRLGGVDANCCAGYTGGLYAVCEKGYSRQFNRCIKCPGPEMAVLQFMGYAAFFIARCFLISWADKITLNSTEKRIASRKTKNKLKKKGHLLISSYLL